MKHLIKTKFKQFTVLALLSFALAGCNKSDLEKYGYNNAYTFTSTDNVVHAPSKVSYYIHSSVTGNYKTAVNEAIPKADALTSAVTVNSNGTSSSKFIIKVANLGSGGNVAQNVMSYYSSGKVISSTITFNSYYMSSYTYNQIRHVALHELGHTFGLKNLDNSKYQEYSIMYTYAPPKSSSYIFSDYQEFDKDNIVWYYGK